MGRIARWVLLGALLAACTAPPPAVASPSPTATGPVPVQVTATTQQELQDLLSRQHQALDKRDLPAYQATLDLTRNAFRRCKLESFDIAGRQGAAATAPRVVRVEPYGGTYVRAWVDQGQGADRGVTRMYFRMQDGRWVQSDPTSDEVGAEKKTTIDGIDIDYWAIDDDVVEAFRQGTLVARDTVVKNQLAESKRPFGIRFYPSRSVQGIVECNVVGFHLPNRPEDKYIRFFLYWFTSDGKALSPDTISFIQHEGLHWAQDQFITGIGARLDWWLVEGWPDYIGQSRTPSYKRTVICTTTAPTYKQLADGPRTDLPDTKPEDAVRYYAFANTMIEYLYAQFGPDAYRKLLLAYKDLADPNRNLPAVLGVTTEEFRTGWLAFSKKRYC